MYYLRISSKSARCAAPWPIDPFEDSGRALIASDGAYGVCVRVLGLATIADAVCPELAVAAIESIDVLGALHASAAGQAICNRPPQRSSVGEGRLSSYTVSTPRPMPQGRVVSAASGPRT